MSRMIAVSVGVLALSLAAADARAEERASDDAGRAAAVDRTDSSVVDTVKDGSATETAGPADTPDFEPLSDDELAVLEKAAARAPELEDRAGGYVSNEELLTIVLVVLLVVIVI